VGFWHRTKVMLGLADDYDEEYEEYDRHGFDEDDDFDEGRPARGAGSEGTRYESPYGTESTRSVHRVERDPDLPRARHATGGGRERERSGREPLREVSTAWGEQPQGREPQVKMHIVEPRSFGEAQTIADKLKGGVPVIMNLTATDPDLSKRLIDFASGLTYGLDGGLQKVADRVFMLTPANVAVSAEDRRRLRDKGLFSLEG
jgi:cell division inhibitor SepF